ncbi:hypothetical protein D9757_008629 [Collybiopsis confluens]|uniref:Uncharacterized protein n=1 Tax=Collybiopsis confluens TaxID=2823264 RepID=A0A8H5H480_9AGAR|nr:hypothetical protein D9757_008629 [Collybiopsis confluens]
MFILLLLSLLQLELASALPTPQSTNGSSPTQVDSNSPTRSTSDIFWSCITTIFACTWVAVHPNVPPSNASNRQLFWRRVKILAVALITPEFIIIWAVVQLRSTLYGLKMLRTFDACKHWTVAHGMFLVMGGFVLADESGTRLEVLQADKLNKLLSDHLITLPHIPESEIMDRSKGDALAKALVLIQTTWFIAQVISRAVLHLPITELELTTVAFALLNFLTYALWWKKPLDVRHPIVITLQCSPQQAAALDLVPILSASSTGILSSYDIPPTATSEVNFADSGYSADNRPSSTASLGEIEPSSENLTLPLHGPHSLLAPLTSKVDTTDIHGNQNKLKSRSFVSFSWHKALRALGGSLRSSVQTCCYSRTSYKAYPHIGILSYKSYLFSGTDSVRG